MRKYKYLKDVCYLDGSPVRYQAGIPLIVKVGKKRWFRWIVEDEKV